MKRKKRATTQTETNTLIYGGSLFFVLASLGITVLSLIATGQSEDVRRQAQEDPYLTIFPTATPTQVVILPTTAIIPTAQPSNTPQPTQIPQHTQPPQPTTVIIKYVVVTTAPTKTATNAPNKTTSSTNNNQTAKQYVPSPTTVSTTQNTAPNTYNPTISVQNSGTQQVSNTAPSIKKDEITKAEEVRRAEERMKEFLEITHAQTPNKTVSSQTVRSQIAQNVLQITESVSTTKSSSNQSTSFSTQQVYHPAEYIPQPEVISKVAQVGALSAALVNQSKKKDTLQIIVEDQGKLVSHTIVIPKSKDGTIDQSSLQTTIAKTISQSNSGQVISSKSVDNVIKTSTQPQPGPLTTAITSVASFFSGKKAQEVASGAQLLKSADIVVKTTATANLPIKGQQINIHFDQSDIVINQISHQNLNSALGQQILPVSAQLQTALNAQSFTQTTQGSLSPIISQQDTSIANLAAAQMNVKPSHVAQAATIQILAAQLGTQGAKVEYVSDKGVQKAYVANSSQNRASSLKTGADELSDANQVKKTVGEQLEKFSQSTGLSHALSAIAFPGIEKIEEEQKLQVQIIHVSGDLNAHPDLNISADTNEGQKSKTAVNQPQAIIVVDDFGNQQVKVFGSESAEKLQSQIEANPQGLLQLINNNLLNALNK